MDEQFQDQVSPDQLRPPMSPYQQDPYKLAREMGILHVVPSGSTLTGILTHTHINTMHLKGRDWFIIYYYFNDNSFLVRVVISP